MRLNIDKAYLVRQVSADAGDHNDAPPAPETLHLLAGGLRCEESPVDVHVEDLRIQ